MIPILYEAAERAFDTYGLGKLSEAISCEVSEERNGSYTLELVYPVSGFHYSELSNRKIILAQPNYTDDPQPFRIYDIEDSMDGSTCTIYAEHISYDMSGYIIPGGLSADGISKACELLTEYAEDFTIKTTKSGSSTFATDVPASVRSWLGGKTGSMLDQYGGEWKWDGLTATLMTNRGEDRGVVIRYGKNLLSLTQTKDSGNVYTGVIAYWYDSENEILVQSDEISTGLELDTPKIYVYDVSSNYEEEPSVDTLNTVAQNYIDNNELVDIETEITLDFLQLGELSERVDLCDTVLVKYERLGIETSQKCTEVVWDVLNERYTSITLGTSSTNIVDRLVESEKVSEEFKSVLETAIARVSSTIKNSQAGYIVHNDTNNDGYIDELLIMDTPDTSTATCVWRWNLNGLAYSSTGYDGTYSTAITMDGEIVADFIATGTMYADRIKGGTLTLGGDSNSYGILEIQDADGNTIGTWDKTGITAENATISGVLTAGSGSSIGGWTATDTKLYAGDADSGVAVIQTPTDSTTWCIGVGGTSHSSYSDCPFRVSKTGALYAAKVTIAGNLTMSGDLYITEDNNDNTGNVAYLRAKRADTGYSVAFGVGSGGYNRGIWDVTAGLWTIYRGSDNAIHIGQASDTTDIYIKGKTRLITSDEESLIYCAGYLAESKTIVRFTIPYVAYGASPELEITGIRVRQNGVALCGNDGYETSGFTTEYAYSRCGFFRVSVTFSSALSDGTNSDAVGVIAVFAVS